MLTLPPARTLETLTIHPWPDDVIDSLGHDPRSHYVETYWLGILGPSSSTLVPMTRAAIYTRLSLDREGMKESPERQEGACRALCEQRGWEVRAVYADRNLSAYKRGRRPEYERLLADVRAGEVEVIIVFKLDRLTRQGLAGAAEVLDACREHGVQLVAVHDPIDTSTAMGEGILGMLASMAKQESQNISIRVADAHNGAASKGRMHGGGSRQFGYSYSGDVVEDEAAVVRELAGRVADGASLRSLARELNERGVTTTMGNEWRSSTLGQMLRSPRLAGQRVHNGDVHQGTWKPILSQEKHARVLEALSRPLAQRRAVRRHLLTGLAVCGRCGGPLKTMGFRMKNGKPFERYQCVRAADGRSGNCGRVAAAKGSLDRAVKDKLLDFLSSAELRPVDDQGAREDLERLVAEDERAQVELTQARFVQRAIGDEEYRVARDALAARLADTQAQLAALGRREEHAQRALRPGERADLEAWWEGATLEEQREALAASVERVLVMPAKRRGGNVFDQARVRIEWRRDLYLREVEAMSDEAYLEAEEEDGGVAVYTVRHHTVQESRAKRRASR